MSITHPYTEMLSYLISGLYCTRFSKKVFHLVLLSLAPISAKKEKAASKNDDVERKNVEREKKELNSQTFVQSPFKPH